jgi:hypothetical protein
MIAFVFAAIALTEAPVGNDVFACSYVKDEKSEPDSHIVDLRAERRTTAEGEVWLLNFADGTSIQGKAVEASFGSIGGGTGIEWRDKNEKVRRAFVSYSDIVLPGGQKAMFLSLGKPSLWQPPGYACQTAALKENRQ